MNNAKKKVNTPNFNCGPPLIDYSILLRASSRMRLALTGLKTPQEQNRAMYVTACAGVRRPSLTQSIILRARLDDTMP